MLHFAHEKAILPALLTPFDARGEISFATLEALVDRLLAEGLDGFYVMGSSAEVMLLSTEERMRAAAAVLKRVDGRVPVIVQVGSANLREAQALARHAAEHGASAVSSVPPFY